MKFTVIFTSLMGLTFASHAQQPPQASPAASQFDQSQKVLSPNRTPSKTLAMSSKGDMHKRHGDRSMQADNAAIQWIDSSGKTMGRAIGDYAILTTFDNQFATLTRLGADTSCDANRVCTFASNGAKWSEFVSVYYTTADCTGTPYSLSGAVGTPYLGVPVTDSGGTYLYFFKAVDTRRVTLQSRYGNDGCFAIGSRAPLSTDATPVSDVVPAAMYGTPPFFLK